MEDLIWRKSSKCETGACAEVAEGPCTGEGCERCEAGACVEYAVTGDAAYVRDTKTGTTLTFTHAEWRAFRAGVLAGEFDL